MSVTQNAEKLKDSLVDRVMVRFLRDSIKRVEDMEHAEGDYNYVRGTMKILHSYYISEI